MDFAALQHSVFLQALGSAILNSLWQCFILWLIYETISASYKAASARFKNNLGTLLLFFSFAWFIASFILKIFSQQNVGTTAAVLHGFAPGSQPGSHAVSGLSAILSSASALLPYFSVAYIFLLFFLMSRLFAAYRYVYFISNKRLINPNRELQLFASTVAFEIGITKKISVWISNHIDVPATIGFIKPVILIPLASINNLSGHQLEAIILHELAHIKRNDYVTNLVISLIETILFFNPFVVLLSNVIKRERENCCDDFVLKYRYDPHSYASALLRLEQSRMSILKLAIGAVSGKKQLLSRIKRITNNQVVSRQFNYGQKMIALILVTAIICSVAWLSPEEKKSVAPKALAKGIKPVPQPKAIKPMDKKNQVDVLLPGKPNEVLPALPVLNLKHVFQKNEPDTVTETDNEYPPQENFSDDADDKNDDNPDFFKVGKNPYPETFTLTKPGFFFDEKNIKLPRFNIQNFPFQNMNLTIGPGRIDMGQLNKNLKLAYDQLNKLDWKKVQNEILKSFPNLKSVDLSQKEPNTIYIEKLKALSKINSKINIIRDQRQFDSKAIIEKLQKEAAMQDSLQSEEATIWNDNNVKIQQAHRQMQRQYERKKSTTNFYYNYANDNNVVIAGNDEEPTTVCTQKNSTPQHSQRKIIRISVNRTPAHTGVLSEKKPLQFTFFYDDDEKPAQTKGISVDVND